MDIAKQISALMAARKADSMDQLLEVFKVMGADVEITPLLEGQKPNEGEIRQTVEACKAEGCRIVNVKMNLKGKSIFGMLVLPA